MVTESLVAVIGIETNKDKFLNPSLIMPGGDKYHLKSLKSTRMTCWSSLSFQKGFKSQRKLFCVFNKCWKTGVHRIDCFLISWKLLCACELRHVKQEKPVQLFGLIWESTNWTNLQIRSKFTWFLLCPTHVSINKDWSKFMHLLFSWKWLTFPTIIPGFRPTRDHQPGWETSPLPHFSNQQVILIMHWEVKGDEQTETYSQQNNLFIGRNKILTHTLDHWVFHCLCVSFWTVFTSNSPTRLWGNLLLQVS